VPPEVVFRLPPPSTSRLVLLGTTLGAFALFTASWMVLRLGPGVGADPACLTPDAASTIVACTDPAISARGAVLLAAPAALAVFATTGARLLPGLLVRMRRLEPLPADHPVRPQLARMTAAAGLSREPQWYHPAGITGETWTFGHRPRHRVVIAHGGLAGLLAGRDVARGLVAHELAHLRNRDVDRTYTLLIAAALAVVAAGWLLVDAAVHSGIVGAALGVRALLLAALVGLTVLAVLRAREHDADLRAATSEPVGVRVWLAGPAPPQRLPYWLAHHPPVDSRRGALSNPATLLRVSPVEFLTTGLAAGLTITELGPVIGRLLVGWGAFPAYVLVGFVVGLPVAAVVCLACTRAHLTGRPAVRELAVAGAVLGAGLAGGTELSLRSSASWQVLFATADDREARSSLLAADPASAAWLVALAVAGGVLFTVWSSAAGRAWLRGTGPRPLSSVLLTAAVLAAPLGGWFLTVRVAAADAWPLPLLSAALTGPVGVAVLLFPVVAGWAVLVRLRRAARERSRWWPAAAVIVGLVLAVGLPSLALPTPSDDVPVVPATRQAGIACVWLTGEDVLVRPRTPGDLGEVGRYLARTDDPGLQMLGSRLVEADSDAERAAAAAALTRWCLEYVAQNQRGPR
jgi:Zn-dependent protease with chaperone function